MVENRYLILEKKNEVYLSIEAESDIRRELSEFFTFEVPGYKFMPQYRNRYWDGKIRLFKYASAKYTMVYYLILESFVKTIIFRLYQNLKNKINL